MNELPGRSGLKQLVQLIIADRYCYFFWGLAALIL